jgi:hypothetical protein
MVLGSFGLARFLDHKIAVIDAKKRGKDMPQKIAKDDATDILQSIQRSILVGEGSLENKPIARPPGMWCTLWSSFIEVQFVVLHEVTRGIAFDFKVADSFIQQSFVSCRQMIQENMSNSLSLVLAFFWWPFLWALNFESFFHGVEALTLAVQKDFLPPCCCCEVSAVLVFFFWEESCACFSESWRARLLCL